MIQNSPEFKNEIFSLFIKVFLPAIVAVGIKIAVQMKTSRITILSAVTSLIIGVGCAFLGANLIRSNFDENWQPIIIGVVAIVGEKIGYWMIFKFNFDKIGEAIVDTIIKALKK